jgi:cell division protein FtsB
MIWWGAWVLMAALLFGNGGFRQLLSCRSDARRQRAILAELQAKNVRFTREWAEIQSDPAYTEYLIRKDLGYVKKDEIEYRVDPH